MGLQLSVRIMQVSTLSSVHINMFTVIMLLVIHNMINYVVANA